MLNVLSLSESTAKSMLPCSIKDMYHLHIDTIITKQVIETIFTNGYSFVPIYEDESDPDNVTLVLLTKALLLLMYRTESESIRIRELPLLPLRSFHDDTIGTEIFVALQQLSPSIAAITDHESNNVIGVLTLRYIT